MVKEWKAALEPYELNDSLLSEVYMAAAHGAVEVLAEQWKIRNIAYANLLAFPRLVGTQGSHSWDELTEVWINLLIPSCDLDKLRPDGIHFCYDQSGIIQHTVIFEFTRANDKFEGFSGDKRAQKHIRYEPLRNRNSLLPLLATWPF